MYKIKNLSTKKFEQGLLEEFLDFANKSLEIDKPYSVYFVDDKDNASDALGKTAMYNPSTNSVYVYVTDRHPKDVLRSVAHELMHHKQNCDGRLDRTYGEGSDDLEMLEREANEAGYLVRQFEDGGKNISEEMELNENPIAFLPGVLVILGSFLLAGDTDFERLQNKGIKKLRDLYKEGKISKDQAIRGAIKIRKLTERPEVVLTLETWTELLDLIGVFPGVGEPFDLISALIKIYLIITKYSKPPHDEDKFELPFFDFWIYTRNYLIIDAVASILGATTIGEPIKLAMKGFHYAGRNIKLFMLANRTLQRVYATLLEPGNSLTVLLNKVTGGRWIKDLEDAQASLKASLKRADALVDSVKARGKIDKVVGEIDNLDEVEAFQFITGATQIGKGPLGGRTFSLLDRTGELSKIFDEAYGITLARKGRQLVTATEEFVSSRISSFNEYVEDLVKNMDSAEAARVRAVFDGLEDADKALIGYITDEAFALSSLSTAGNVGMFYVEVIKPLVNAAKSGKKVTKADLQKYLNKLPAGTKEIYEVLGQIPEVIDFSKAVKSAEDIVLRRTLEFYTRTFYKRVLREEIGKIVQQRLKKVKEGVDKTFEELEYFIDGKKPFNDLSPGAKEAVNHPDTWVTSRYVDAQNEIMGEMASSGGDLMQQAEQAAFKRAQTGEGPIKRAMSVPKRVATQARSLRAAIRGTVGRGTASVKVTNYFLATLSRNLLGRGAISGMVFQDRMVNFVPKLMGEILGSAAKAGPVSKVVHALYATTLTAWLRVMSLDELDLGGGEEGGAASAAQMALSAMKRAEEKKRQEAANAQLQKVAKVTNNPFVVTVFNSPVTLPSASTATKARQALDPLKDQNPKLAEQVTKTQKAIDEYAEKVKNKPKPEDRKEAAIKLSKKLTETADDGLQTAKEKTATTVQESPKVKDVPVGVKQRGLENADKTDERAQGTKEDINKILKGGAGQKGEGSGAGGLAGTGGTATGRKGASKLSLGAISQYIDQVDPFAHPLLPAPDRVKPRNTIYYKNFKSVPPQALRRSYKGLIDAYNKAAKGAAASATGTADTVVDVDNLKRVFPNATFQDLPVENGKITNFRSFVNWLNNTKKVIEEYKGTPVMENNKKCFASYRERVFNERFDKLTKGFTR